jgi:hypothetical protein
MLDPLGLFDELAALRRTHPAVPQQHCTMSTRGHDDRRLEAPLHRLGAVIQAMTFDGAESCPSRSAAAVALEPAEQQCDETPRGGRTQLDVDGAVSGHRL